MNYKHVIFPDAFASNLRALTCLRRWLHWFSEEQTGFRRFFRFVLYGSLQYQLIQEIILSSLSIAVGALDQSLSPNKAHPTQLSLNCLLPVSSKLLA